MSDDTRPYYYRLRGRTLGPFDLRQIRQKAKQAQIGASTPVSRDGVEWHAMSNYPEISQSDGPGVQPSGNGGGGGGVAEGEQWYYAIGGNQQGPVPLATLQQYVAGGMLKGDDVVIKEGDATWMPVKNVPALYSLVKTDPTQPPVGPRPAPAPGETNGMAIAGFVCSLVGLGPIALVLSLVALKSPNQANRGLAIAGAIIGGIETAGCLGVCGCYGLSFILVVIGQAAR